MNATQTAATLPARPSRYKLDRATPRPRTMIVIKSRNALGGPRFKKSVEVLRPAGPERQHRQLVSVVTDLFPDARLHAASGSKAVFVVGTAVVTASYEDLQ